MDGIRVGNDADSVAASAKTILHVVDMFPEHARTSDALIKALEVLPRALGPSHVSITGNTISIHDTEDEEDQEEEVHEN